MNLVSFCDDLDFNNIDANSRPSPLLEQKMSNRLVNIAIPYLFLYAPTSLAVSLGMGTVKTWSILTGLVKAGRAGDWNKCAVELRDGALVAASVAFSILRPKISALISHGTQLVYDMSRLQKALEDRDFKQAGLSVLSFANTAIYLGSIFVATPEFIALSLLAQAVLEVYRACQQLKNGNYLEVLGNLGLAIIRSYQSMPHLDAALKNYYGFTNITQEGFEQLLKDLQSTREENSNAKLDFKKLLRKKNHASLINGISFKEFQLDQFVFNNLSFANCSFEKTSLEKATFSNVSFSHCLFDRANVINTIFKSASFVNCSFVNTLWNYSKLNHVSWVNCIFSGASFNDATINSSVFNLCKMFETSFFGSRIEKSVLANSDLTDCLIFRAKKEFIIHGGIPLNFTRPVVGMLWNYKNYGAYAAQTVELLKNDFNALVLKIEYSPEDINEELLGKEVQNSLNHLKTENSRDLSVLQAILKDPKQGSQIERIQEKAKEGIEAINALWIPGGEDINPKYYGKSLDKDQSASESADGRTLVEAAFIRLARLKKIFTLGVCRGSQILNVEGGGTLVQDVDDHFSEIHKMELKKGDNSKPVEIMRTILGKECRIEGLSMHHQANDLIGKEFTKVLDHKGSTEAIVSNDGNAVGVQFHPEGYEYFKHSGKPESVWQTNRNFFVYFLKRASDYMTTVAT